MKPSIVFNFKSFAFAQNASLLGYGVSIWASCFTENLMRILRPQKCAARVILDADTRANSIESFKQLNWLTFCDEVKLNK